MDLPASACTWPEGGSRAAVYGRGRLDCLLTCKGPLQYDGRPEGEEMGVITINWGGGIFPQVTTFQHRTQSSPRTINPNFASQVIFDGLFSKVGELNVFISIVC